MMSRTVASYAILVAASVFNAYAQTSGRSDMWAAVQLQSKLNEPSLTWLQIDTNALVKVQLLASKEVAMWFAGTGTDCNVRGAQVAATELPTILPVCVTSTIPQAIRPIARLSKQNGTNSLLTGPEVKFERWSALGTWLVTAMPLILGWVLGLATTYLSSAWNNRNELKTVQVQTHEAAQRFLMDKIFPEVSDNVRSLIAFSNSREAGDKNLPDHLVRPNLVAYFESDPHDRLTDYFVFLNKRSFTSDLKQYHRNAQMFNDTLDRTDLGPKAQLETLEGAATTLLGISRKLGISIGG